MTARSAVLDASALLAFLFNEPGADSVAEVLGSASISTVNWAEVYQHAHRHGDMPRVRALLERIGLEIAPLSAGDAELAGELREPTRHLGLSLADRCCLALAIRAGVPVLTADSQWPRAELGAEIVLIR
jgi:ribonuclease VapC